MFGMYSISMTDANGNSWSIKRRATSASERICSVQSSFASKAFPLIRFRGPVVRERCKLLDIYLKTYIFAKSLSVIHTLSVTLDERSNEKNRKASNSSEALNANLISGGQSSHGHKDDTWMAPNVSVPMFHLVDVVFQLQDGGWIRRQAFWVAKQLLQLGMGDMFDDWLVDKIQLLKKGRIIAVAVKRVEQVSDYIFSKERFSGLMEFS